MAAVTGSAQTRFSRRTDGSSFRDWASEAFEAALLMATLDRADVDTLIVASESDFFTLQLNPAAILAGDLGLVGVATMRVEGGGASGQLAVHAAAQAIASGQARHVAVIGVDPSASQLPAATIKLLYGYSFDAWTDGMTGTSATALYALSYQAFAARIGLPDKCLDQIALQNRANAMLNPNAHLPRQHKMAEIADSPLIASPYRRLHCSPLSDGAAAIILSHPDALPGARGSAPRITGIGAASDHAQLGARQDTGTFTAKRKAMQRACQQAGIGPADIDVAEVYDAYAGAQLQALNVLGLSETLQADLDAQHFAPEGRLPINLSGGLLGQGAPVGATGVAQTATCALLLEGRYHPELQPKRPLRHALADTHGGVCTTAAVTLLSQADAK
ncbi:thiolase family protein [Devosia rhodophyticola]|uniref:Thiolase family protein n=1 Tax=Devosia rhodophyticola TaxID=3026423 RepID=A0ABY7YYN4_9HYPH|nr:thiolase family protein [Devosia rhodophyticola]WDR06267.1 thiolase family protein [Devosia rhodophyticola]